MSRTRSEFECNEDEQIEMSFPLNLSVEDINNARFVGRGSNSGLAFEDLRCKVSQALGWDGETTFYRGEDVTHFIYNKRFGINSSLRFYPYLDSGTQDLLLVIFYDTQLTMNRKPFRH